MVNAPSQLGGAMLDGGAVRSTVTPTGLRIPERLGRFQVIAELATGGMGQILLAVQRGAFASNKIVVIKKIRKDALDTPEFLHMFVDEARIAMRLSHPNIVNTFDFVEEDESLYLTMEFLEGHSLLHVLRKVGRDSFPLDLHLWILTRVLAALSYMHALHDLDGAELGIVHRDVSPSNVILTHSGEVKLVDFGIAQAAGRLSVTQNGTLKGKIGYMSPEQCRLEPATLRSDIYAVGVMLWEALTKQRRRVGNTAFEALQERLRGNEPHVLDACPEVPRRLVEIVDKALALQPAERYATAADLQKDLEAYLASASPLQDARSTTLIDFLAQHLGPEIATLRKTIEVRIAADRTSLAHIPGAETISEVSEVSNVSDDDIDAEATIVSDDLPSSSGYELLSPPLAVSAAFDETVAARTDGTPVARALALTRSAFHAVQPVRHVPKTAWVGVAMAASLAGGMLIHRTALSKPAARIERATTASPSAQAAFVAAVPHAPEIEPIVTDLSPGAAEVPPEVPAELPAEVPPELPEEAHPLDIQTNALAAPPREARLRRPMRAEKVMDKGGARGKPWQPPFPALGASTVSGKGLVAKRRPISPINERSLGETSFGQDLGSPAARVRLPLDEKDPFTP